MPEIVQFPPETSTAAVKGEPDQIITLLNAQTQLRQGGETSYTSIASWKNANYAQASKYTGVVIEFSCSEAGTFGDGTQAQAIGLFGEITGEGKFLLGLLGLNLGGEVPQVVICTNSTAQLIGFAQITCDISLYDKLSVGGVFADVFPPGDGSELTVKARPIRQRDYIG